MGGSIFRIVPRSSYGLPCHSPRWISALPGFQSVSVSTPKNQRLISSGVVIAFQTSSIGASIEIDLPARSSVIASTPSEGLVGAPRMRLPDGVRVNHGRAGIVGTLRGAQFWRLNHTPPGPLQLSPSPHVAIVFPSLVMAISP